MSATESSATANADSTVLVSASGGLGSLVLNRPKALNALSYDMIVALGTQLEQWRLDKDIDAVLIRGAGEKGLCAGGDVRALRDEIIGGDLDTALTYFRAEYSLNALIAEYPKPVIVIADGITMGGGIGLAGHASVRVVTERSKLAMPETRIGFTPDVGGTWLLANAPGRLGEYFGLTGAVMSGADAIEAGLADSLIPSDRLESFIDALQHRADPGSPAEIVLLFDETPGAGVLAAARDWIDDAFSRDTVAEIIARLDELEGDAAQAADTLRELSPSSLAITLTSIRAARYASGLRSVLEQEYNLAAFLMRRPDMAEGIRAQLVDKTRDPAWSPASIDEVETGLGERALQYRATPALWD